MKFIPIILLIVLGVVLCVIMDTLVEWVTPYADKRYQ